MTQCAMKTIWIISEGSPGHISQSVGLAESLAALIPLQTITIKGRAKVRGWLRPAIRWFMGTNGRPLKDFALNKIADIEIPSGALPPDVIISSGGKSVFAAKTLAERYEVPYVFIGEHKPYPAKWFHTIISPVPGESCSHSIDIELIPTPVATQSVQKTETNEKGLWCMIIGGTSRSHRFNDTDWKAIAEGMNRLSKRENIRWLLTTSRRTGPEAERQLKSTLEQSVLVDAIWWSEYPRRELYDFMGRAEIQFVTQDSVTMVSEAVSIGKPVVVIAPIQLKFPRDSFLPAYFARLESNHRIARVVSTNIQDIDINGLEFCPLMGNNLHLMADELIKRLGWK